MGLFENILKGMNLLREGASVNDVNDAISNMHPAVITYSNNEGGRQARGERKIYPVAYGISTAGNPVVRAFENEGDTTTRVPAWKLFLLSNIDSWKTESDESFRDVPLKGLSKDGKDKQIATLYNVSPLSDSAKSWINREPVIKSVPVTKDDVSGNAEYSAEDIVNRDVNYAVSSKSLDNQGRNSYINPELSLMNAEPETKPVDKDEIDGGAEQNARPDNQSERMYADNTPVSRDDVEGDDDIQDEPEITSAYNDLMDRWDKGSVE